MSQDTFLVNEGKQYKSHSQDSQQSDKRPKSTSNYRRDDSREPAKANT